MKKKLFSILVYVTIALGIIVGLIIFLSVSLYDEIELANLRENKNFWKWSTQHGSLNMHFVEQGSGDKHILLIHGFRAHTYTWNSITQPLIDSGYHVWSIDLIGFGLSDKPNYVSYNQSFFVEQIKDFMQNHAIETAHLVGNSMGGAIALELALHKPELVDSITLINALGYKLNVPFYIYMFRNMDFIWGPFLNPPIIRECLKGVICDHSCVTEEKVEAYCLPYRFPGGIESSLLTMRHFDVDRLEKMHLNFSQITAPMLIIWGEGDTLIPFDHYQHFLRDFPKANTVALPDCGHMPQEEKPLEVASAFLDFINHL